MRAISLRGDQGFYAKTKTVALTQAEIIFLCGLLTQCSREGWAVELEAWADSAYRKLNTVERG